MGTESLLDDYLTKVKTKKARETSDIAKRVGTSV